MPYIVPGFGLAKAAAEVFDADPEVEGLILDKHGIFTFGASAREAYERMIEMVTLAEAAAAARAQARCSRPRRCRTPVAAAGEVAPILRGACALRDGDVEGAWRRLIMEFRSQRRHPRVRQRQGGGALCARRRDHARPHHPHQGLAADRTAAGGGQARRLQARRAQGGAAFVADYHDYFARNNARVGGGKHHARSRAARDPGAGARPDRPRPHARRTPASPPTSPRARSTRSRDAEAIGQFRSIGEADMFDCEYWPPEQAKLARAKEPPLAGQVVAVTGAGGAIGAATARLFAAAGAEVALLDVDLGAAEAKARAIGSSALAVACDVTDAASVRAAFDQVVETYGGVDIVVSNAGAAWQGRIGEVDEAVLRKSFELNFFAHQRVAQAAVRIMLAQGTGGCLLFNVSKQAVNPGPNFGPYGLPKAATLFLVRQYALDYGADGIRANAVNADRIRSGLLTDEFIKSALDGARRDREGLHERQSAGPRGHRRGRGAGLPAPGAGAQDHGRRDHGRRRQHRRGVALADEQAACDDRSMRSQCAGL